MCASAWPAGGGLPSTGVTLRVEPMRVGRRAGLWLLILEGGKGGEVSG